jgi:hypothetical protein
MLGAYPDFSNICLKYQPRYQNDIQQISLGMVYGVLDITHRGIRHLDIQKLC